MKKYDYVVAMASLRLDKGEDLNYGYDTIARMAPKKPHFYLLTIVCE